MKSFAFFGTPQLAADILEALHAHGFAPSVIVTMPDRQQGRGMEMKETPVAAWARVHGIDTLKPEALDAAFVSDYKLQSINYQLSFAVVVAYGKILPQPLLETMPMYNIHYSLLPRWRGATPVESAILADDAETGVSIQKIVYKLDAGPIVAEARTPIEPHETAPMLRERLNGIAASLLIDTMPRLFDGTLEAREQDESLVTTCGKIKKEDGLVDLADDAEILYRAYRAYFGWPGIYTYFERAGKRIRTIITKAHLEHGKFVIDIVKPEGKGKISYADFVRSGAQSVSPTVN